MANQYTPRKLPIKPVGPSIAYIPLTKGLFALVDFEDADWLGRSQWYAQLNVTTNSYYAVRYIPGIRPRKLEWMHKAILRTPDRMQGDHRFHVTLDNRRSQLRNVTQTQNCINRRPRGSVVACVGEINRTISIEVRP